jgi:hypothetical protein
MQPLTIGPSSVCGERRAEGKKRGHRMETSREVSLSSANINTELVATLRTPT